MRYFTSVGAAFIDEEDTGTVQSLTSKSTGLVVGWKCGVSPCMWAKYGQELVRHGSELKNDYNKNKKKPCKNNRIRNELYARLAFSVAGPLGRRNRVEIPHCVRDGICNHCPEADETDYVAHRD